MLKSDLKKDITDDDDCGNDINVNSKFVRFTDR